MAAASHKKLPRSRHTRRLHRQCPTKRDSGLVSYRPLGRASGLQPLPHIHGHVEPNDPTNLEPPWLRPCTANQRAPRPKVWRHEHTYICLAAQAFARLGLHECAMSEQLQDHSAHLMRCLPAACQLVAAPAGSWVLDRPQQPHHIVWAVEICDAERFRPLPRLSCLLCPAAAVATCCPRAEQTEGTLWAGCWAAGAGQ
jgi:hypothetical protein